MAATPWASDRNWELVFEDNFDGSSLNAHNWSRIDYAGYNAPDWRKYQSRDESLVEFREKDGNSAMTLWGKYGDYTTQTNQTAPARTYACGGVYSLKTFSFQYGYVEVRARFDCVQGVWPAIWMMPKSDSIGWPVGGEIDIMEHLNYEAVFTRQSTGRKRRFQPGQLPGGHPRLERRRRKNKLAYLRDGMDGRRHHLLCGWKSNRLIQQTR